MVSIIHTSTDYGCYLPLAIVGALIFLKKYLSLARVYPGIPPVVGMIRVTLEGYLYSWTSDKQNGILNFEDKITFGSVSESWPVFRIDMTGILIKRGLLQLIPITSFGGSVITLPTYIFSMPVWERYLIWQ